VFLVSVCIYVSDLFGMLRKVYRVCYKKLLSPSKQFRKLLDFTLKVLKLFMNL
jgi:hypothetical protein